VFWKAYVTCRAGGRAGGRRAVCAEPAELRRRVSDYSHVPARIARRMQIADIRRHMKRGALRMGLTAGLSGARCALVCGPSDRGPLRPEPRMRRCAAVVFTSGIEIAARLKTKYPDDIPHE
jgi:hypothetical protein